MNRFLWIIVLAVLLAACGGGGGGGSSGEASSSAATSSSAQSSSDTTCAGMTLDENSCYLGYVELDAEAKACCDAWIKTQQ
ncbi:MAG: hypothetical protein JXK05_02530 [Campylobacterales bacterium]|nr:hypothetical protein [Campylobacterales bacterium]